MPEYQLNTFGIEEVLCGARTLVYVTDTSQDLRFGSLNVFNDDVLVLGFAGNDVTTAVSLTTGRLDYLLANSGLTNAYGTGNNDNHGSG